MIERRTRVARRGGLTLPLLLALSSLSVSRVGAMDVGLVAFGYPLPAVEYGLSGPLNLIPANRSVVEAVSGATAGDGDAASDGLTGATVQPSIFGDKISFHKAAGWTSASLFLAAGVVGAVRAYSLMSAGHEYRDSLGISEETMGTTCSDKIADLWADGGGQALRWIHVGLLVAGEALYVSNALSGMSLFAGDDGPGLSRSDIHRYAFYIHASLMVAEVALGFLTSSALSRGDHQLISEVLGPAHVAVGFAIPAVIFTAGALMETGALAQE